MAEESQDDKTEEPTARRLEKAKEDGQVLRSQDMTIAAVTGSVIASLYLGGFWMGPRFVDTFAEALTIPANYAFEANLATNRLSALTLESFVTVIPVFALAIVAAIGSATALGGFVFSAKAFAPKASKLNPIKGMSRIFGLKALVELGKSVAKFSLVASIGGSYLYFNFDSIMQVGNGPINNAIGQSVETVLLGALVATVALVIIAMIDVPYQRYEFIKKLKMTKQEIKDEMKDIEGQPEVKQRIRAKQREMAQQRQLDDVPSADVIITNPQHFAVALVYEMDKEDAPRVVAKGKNFMAKRIRERATDNSVEIFESPLLARALYFTCDVGMYIPAGLFHAVAQVIAYVYSLNSVSADGQRMTKPKPQIPDDMVFDESGRRRETASPLN
ncbi:MAG: flagellar biosynthesis protein FlhB [Gammaproteobacteria bacterium]|jgi:flagellar biosynthetic protein FlhB|nr:flagellar biosynthesis protein FlhB [Gammaproteobacteria bacterium]